MTAKMSLQHSAWLPGPHMTACDPLQLLPVGKLTLGAAAEVDSEKVGISLVSSLHVLFL